MSNVQVAVRVRPFNAREKAMNAKLIIAMDGAHTRIRNPESGEEKPFAFDFSYWSHDSFREGENGLLIPESSKYADQKKVFADIGQSVLDNAWKGFNCSLFAYGQTGSGKSFSMMGYGVNVGIIPMTCEDIFKRTSLNSDPSKTYEVYVSMLEIYNEAIRDLFNPKNTPQGGLKIREKKGIGVYVDELTQAPVRSYKEVEKRMDEGTRNRTVASTNMNATSSRAHTVFTITFKQISTDGNGVKSMKESNVNLVDLAGSERAESTGATGDRLKEGCAINQSLSALGNVISALAEKSGGKKGVFIPYRSSKLTRLLQDALGGNSKTIMIAALSPADVNYDESLSTLKYADRAKKIKNNAIVNENPTDRMIRLLKEENERLLKLLADKGINATSNTGSAGGEGETSLAIDEAHRRELQRTIEENNRMLEEMKKSWEEKLKDAENRVREGSRSVDDGSISFRSAAASQLPHLVNLHEDPMLSECVVYTFKMGVTTIGRETGQPRPQILLNGLNIKPIHAQVEHSKDHKVFIRPLDPGAKVFVNGELVNEQRELTQGERVVLGNNFVFRFIDPKQHVDEASLMSWEKAMEELGTKQGFRTQQQGVTFEVNRLEEEERKMLEQKIKEMESVVEKEREKAQKALEAQRELFKANGADLSDKELQAMIELQDEEFAAKEMQLESSLAEQKERTRCITKDQMKRKRQTKKIEEELGRLMPLINEANSLAEELKKTVRFEARLQVRSPKAIDLDELRHLKTIEIAVRMTDTVNENVWNWGHEKFESRLFIIRDLYANGVAQTVQLADDPFWDPPEPIEIGRAYVYLKALNHLVEIENDFSIVNYKGETDGQLRVEIFPSGSSGEELDYLQQGKEELIGMDVRWQIRVPRASNIPTQNAYNVHATFTFQDVEYETKMCEGKSIKPQFDYELDLPPAQVTAELCEFFENEPIVFQVKGFRQPVQVTLPSTLGQAYEAICEHCESSHPFFECEQCHLKLCVACDDFLHLSPVTKSHSRVAIQIPHLIANGAGAVVCSQCEEQSAMLKCAECDKSFCYECNDFLHLAPSKKSHRRQRLGTDAAAVCEFCEENDRAVSCVECTQQLCTGCNAFLHLAPAKAKHKRIPI